VALFWQACAVLSLQLRHSFVVVAELYSLEAIRSLFMPQMMQAAALCEFFAKLIYRGDLLFIGGPPNLRAAFSASYFWSGEE
jgi:hypothetical protein